MADAKLKFYIGDITEGGKDGIQCNSVEAVFSDVLSPGKNDVQVPFCFAIRCDEGYRAEAVQITFSSDIDLPIITSTGWSNSKYGKIDVGTVNNTNKVIFMGSALNKDSYLKIHLSYTEVKI